MNNGSRARYDRVERAGLKATEAGDPDEDPAEPRGVQRSAMPERLGWGEGEGMMEDGREREKVCRREEIEMRRAAMRRQAKEERLIRSDRKWRREKMEAEKERPGFRVGSKRASCPLLGVRQYFQSVFVAVASSLPRTSRQQAVLRSCCVQKYKT